VSRWTLLLALLLAPVGASAAVCRVMSGSALSFGAYDLLAPTPRDSQMNLVVTCDGTGSPQTVALSVRVNQGAGGFGGTRRMAHTGGTGDFLEYGLYRDPARSSVWGVSEGVNTVGAALAVPAAGSVSATFVIYGRIPARQNARTGTYADAVQVTIDY
jgi:spore coat protein U-like protein